MTKVGFHRPHQQRLLALGRAVHLGQRFEFNRIAQRRAGAVGLQHVNLLRLQGGLSERVAHQGLLGSAIGHR